MSDDLTPGAPGESASFTAELDTAFEEPTGAADAIDTAAELPADEPEPVEGIEPVAEAAAPPVETTPAAEAAPPAEVLPEGVRVVEKDGNKEYRVRETQFNQFREGHNLRRELEQRYVPLSEEGKSVTTEDIRAAIDLRDKAYLGNEDMHLDFLSGDPASQGKFVEHWIEYGAGAIARGEVSSDPMVPFAATLFDTLLQKHPEAHDVIQAKSATLLVKDLYELAKQEGDENLKRSAQHIEKRLFNRYLADDGKMVEVAPKQPVTPRQTPQHTAQPVQAAPDQQWQNFRVKADTDSKTAVHKVVETSLAAIKTAYDKAQLPETYGAVLDRLNSVVHKELKGDAEWQRPINIELKQARMAPSEQKRQEIAARIVRRHESRARQIVEKHLATITSEASRSLKVSLDATHQRRAAVQDKRAPAGGGPPARTSLMPAKDDAPWNGQKSFEREIDSLFA